MSGMRWVRYPNCRGYLLCLCTYRNEQYQEELWKRSIAILRDHLSPEVLEKYGPTVSTEKKEEDGTTAAEPEEEVESKEGEKEGVEVPTVNEEPPQPESTLQSSEQKVEVHVDATVEGSKQEESQPNGHEDSVNNQVGCCHVHVHDCIFVVVYIYIYMHCLFVRRTIEGFFCLVS